MSHMPPAVPCMRPLRAQFLARLIDAGNWVSREDLTAGTSSSLLAIEDALADLVVDGEADYRKDVGYRLAGSLQARRAAWLLRNSKTTRAVYAEPVGDQYLVGVAERKDRDSLDLVMYELALPMPEPGPDSLAQQQRMAQAVLDLTTRGV